MSGKIILLIVKTILLIVKTILLIVKIILRIVMHETGYAERSCKSQSNFFAHEFHEFTRMSLFGLLMATWSVARIFTNSILPSAAENLKENVKKRCIYMNQCQDKTTLH